MKAENQSTARITSPCSQAFGRPPRSTNCQIVTTASPVATMTRIPGHQAQKPAKKPQKGPRAFCVHTYSEPSCGNIWPSCALVTAQLGQMFPQEGSLYVWTQKALGPFWGFFAGFCAWWPGILVMVATGDAVVT